MTQEEVEIIHRGLEKGMKNKELAELLGVHLSTIYRANKTNARPRSRGGGRSKSTRKSQDTYISINLKRNRFTASGKFSANFCPNFLLLSYEEQWNAPVCGCAERYQNLR
ncbi:helix-turn-helix domain-containing protein [Streptococcus dysgalactiae]|uniref:helix-turn-helix domain-containing protein n=1 Tax=Streptococcus dysgalactiae TaxID=1334 RepID=UPI001EF1627D|nr:helix-turn-helix domain-containing protein [Streptococcus dysgalactiae]